MSHRVVIDASGVSWELWEVQPSLVEKRAHPEEPSLTTGERRRVRQARLRVSPEMRHGWLAMRSETERRRVAPIPPGWADLSDAELVEMVQRAESVGSPRRLIE